MNNNCCPSYASYLAKPAPLSRTVHFKQGMGGNQTILPVTSPNVYTVFKHYFTSKQNDNSVVKHDQHTCNVATFVRYSGIFNGDFIANFLTSQPVKEL